jgi:hypothetical protein
MPTVKFLDLINNLSHPGVRLREPANVATLGKHHNFYVEQTFEADGPEPLAAHILLIKAPAAVGKTVLAEELSYQLGAPLIDLSVVRASTGTFVGAVDDISFPANATEAFLKGQIPVIVDGLDESPIRSGADNFSAFLRSLWSYLGRNLENADKPRLVMLGRGSNWETVVTSIPENLRVSTLEIDYFDYKAACRVIHAHVESNAVTGSLYRNNPAATQKIIDQYFAIIANALHLDSEKLWTDESGQALAGYAPVLVALANILSAETTSFIELESTYADHAKSTSAWDVIEEITEKTMLRERVKLIDKLTRLKGSPPPSAYDPEEQYRHLIDRVQSHQITWSGRVTFGDDESLDEYRKKVVDWLPQHPFIREFEFSSPVFAAKVLARSIASVQLDQKAGFGLLEDASKRQFLWRSFRWIMKNEPDMFVDGRWLGYILASLATDPLDEATTVEVTYSVETGLDHFEFYSGSAGYGSVALVAPIRLYRTVERCEIATESDVEIYGYSGGGSLGTIYLNDVTLCGNRVSLYADRVIVNGNTYLEASEISGPRDLMVEVASGGVLTVGGRFATNYPWNTKGRPLQEEPPPPPVKSSVAELLESLADSWPAGGMVLNADYSAATARPSSIEVEFGKTKSKRFNRLLVKHGLAIPGSTKAQGGAKIRLRLNGITLGEVALEYDVHENGASRFGEFFEDAERLFFRGV